MTAVVTINVVFSAGVIVGIVGLLARSIATQGGASRLATRSKVRPDRARVTPAGFVNPQAAEPAPVQR